MTQGEMILESLEWVQGWKHVEEWCQAYLVAADWYEEAGELGTALGLRWMSGRKKCPSFYDFPEAEPCHWYWFRCCNPPKNFYWIETNHGRDSRLMNGIRARCKNNTWSYAKFPSKSAACLALARAAAEVYQLAEVL